MSVIVINYSNNRRLNSHQLAHQVRKGHRFLYGPITIIPVSAYGMRIFDLAFFLFAHQFVINSLAALGGTMPFVLCSYKYFLNDY